MRLRQRWARPFLGPAVMTCGAVIVVVSSLLPWVRTGSVSRSSYEMLGLIERLGFVPGGAARVAIGAWPLMPLGVVTAVVASWWGQRWPAAAAGVIGGLYAGALGAVVASAVPDSRAVGVSAAPTFTAAGAAILIAGSLIALLTPSSGELRERRGGLPAGRS